MLRLRVRSPSAPLPSVTFYSMAHGPCVCRSPPIKDVCMTKGFSLLFVALTVAVLTLAGCTPSMPEKPGKKGGSLPVADAKAAKIRAAIEKLDPEDRKIAE